MESKEKPDKSPAIKRRSSILKLKSKNKEDEDDDTNNITSIRSKRVSFASSYSIKPFTAVSEKNTIWDSTYEEDYHTDSAQSLEQTKNKKSLTSIEHQDPNITIWAEQTMDFSKISSDKENFFPQFKSQKISLVDYAKTHRQPTEEMEFTCHLSASKMQEKITIYQDPLVESELLGPNNCEKFNTPVESTMNHTNIESTNQTVAMDITCASLKTEIVKLLNESYETEEGQETENEGLSNHSIYTSKNRTRQNMDASMDFTCQVPNIRSNPQENENKRLSNHITNTSENPTCHNINASMDFTCQVPNIRSSQLQSPVIDVHLETEVNEVKYQSMDISDALVDIAPNTCPPKVYNSLTTNITDSTNVDTPLTLNQSRSKTDMASEEVLVQSNVDLRSQTRVDCQNLETNTMNNETKIEELNGATIFKPMLFCNNELGSKFDNTVSLLDDEECPAESPPETSFDGQSNHNMQNSESNRKTYGHNVIENNSLAMDQFIPRATNLTQIPIRMSSSLLNTPDKLINSPARRNLVETKLSDLSMMNYTNYSSCVDDTDVFLNYTGNNLSYNNTPTVSKTSKLSQINDTYVLKGKKELTINTACKESNNKFDSIKQDQNVHFDLDKYDLKNLRHYDLRIKKVSTLQPLLDQIEQDRKKIVQFIRNFRCRSMRIPDVITVDKRKDEKVLSTDTKFDPLPQVLDMVRAREKSLQINYWELTKTEDDFYYFSTFSGKLELVVQLEHNSSTVINFNRLNKLPERAKPLAKYMIEVFLKQMEEAPIKSAIGHPFDILSLLDYIEMQMTRLYKFQINFSTYDNIDLNQDFVVQFSVISVPLILSAELYIDVTDIGNIKTIADSVRIVSTVGSLNEYDIKNLIETCPSGLDFFDSFHKNLENYIKNKEKKK